jgi:hypothetical protein
MALLTAHPPPQHPLPNLLDVQTAGCSRSLNLKTLNPKPETRNPKPETRNPKPETRNPGDRRSPGGIGSQDSCGNTLGTHQGLYVSLRRDLYTYIHTCIHAYMHT